MIYVQGGKQMERRTKKKKKTMIANYNKIIVFVNYLMHVFGSVMLFNKEPRYKRSFTYEWEHFVIACVVPTVCIRVKI